MWSLLERGATDLPRWATKRPSKTTRARALGLRDGVGEEHAAVTAVTASGRVLRESRLDPEHGVIGDGRRGEGGEGLERRAGARGRKVCRARAVVDRRHQR